MEAKIIAGNITESVLFGNIGKVRKNFFSKIIKRSDGNAATLREDILTSQKNIDVWKAMGTAIFDAKTGTLRAFVGNVEERMRGKGENAKLEFEENLRKCGMKFEKLSEIHVYIELIMPNSKSAPHYHTQGVELACVLEGKGVLRTMDGALKREVRKIGKDAHLHIPNEIEHCIENNGNKTLVMATICHEKNREDTHYMR